jgi:hypothetical protein
MRLLLLISLLFVQTVAFAKPRIRPDSATLVKSFVALHDALMKKDSTILNQVLHKRLTYGHSNGWVQNKKEVIADLFNGKLTFNKIERSNEKIDIVRETATIRFDAQIDVIHEGKPVAMKLNILQVWIWKDKEGWKLMGRQSVKI